MSKFKSITKILKYLPKKTFVAFGLLAAVLVPAAIYAWGPSRATFTMENPASYVTFNSITNNPSEGDERNFVRAKDNNNTSVGGFSDIVPVQNDGTYLVRMYVHNNAADNLNLVAKNVTAVTGLQAGYSTKVCLTGYVNSSNANPTQVYDDVCFTNPENFKINYVGGSARYYNNVNPSGFSIGNELFSTGAKLGYTSMNGDIPGCLQYAGILTFQVKAHLEETPKTPAYDIIKTVDKATARPGDTIKYTLTAKNTGQVDLTNVKINDTLPAYYQNASEQINAPSAISGSIVNGGQVTIAKLPVGTEATITITYKIKGEEAFECDKVTPVKNVVSGTTDQDNTEDDLTNNEANTDVTYECTEKIPSYDLEKTVDKATAKIGDTLTYTLKFTNTGQVDLTNVVIKDQLPSGINWTKVDINVQNGSGISDKDKLFDSGVKIASVKVGGTVTIKITAKVTDKAVTAEECGENTATLVNKAQSKTDQKPDQENNQDEDNPNNNSASTTVTVNKECQPKFDIEKKVDKTSAKPGDTLKYTLTFKNTGEIDLTNAVIKDVLPKGVTLSGDVKAEPADGVSGDLFSAEGLTIAKVEKGKTVVITFNVKVAAATEFICGTTTLKNVVTSTSKELVEEPNTGNNSATTTVEKDCPPEKDRCEIPGKEHLDKDDPNCKVTVTPPPVNPPTDGGSTSTTTKGGYVPSEIVATGPVETIAGLIAAGALTFGGAAYIRSRQAVRKNLLNR